jgi:alpha-L-fucosidase 2
VTPAGNAIEITGADEVEFLLAAATDYKNPAFVMHSTGEAPRAACDKHLEAALKKPFTDLRDTHVADYRKLYDRCTLRLGSGAPSALPTDKRLAQHRRTTDPALEALAFQYGRYLLISSSRPGTMPANLQGIWNNSTSPPWNCDWHTDINIEMNYWPAEVTGLSECHLPLFDLLSVMQVNGRETAKLGFRTRGWYAPIYTNPWGNAVNNWQWLSGSGWLCQHLWEHYQYTGDTEFLAKTGYPLMKDAALFLFDSLFEADSKLVTGISVSPENPRCAQNYGVAMDMQIAWESFGNCIEAAKILDTDKALAKQFAVARARLAPPRIGRWGQLQEWYQDMDDPNDHHRHHSHLWAVFPGHEITPQDTPALAKAAAVSLRARGGAANGWAFPWRSLICARLHDTEAAYRWLKGGMAYTTETRMIYDKGGGMYPNMFGACPPFQIDSNFGTTAAVAEMLLQSHRDEIELLPALPKAWPAGKVTGLRARGGFSVDIEWKDSKVTNYRIASPTPREVKVRVNGAQKSITAQTS